MSDRPFWIKSIENAWETRSLVWLTGVRRVGKTTLARMFPDAMYLNCDLPSVNRRLEDPESLFNSLPLKSLVIFDEVHRLKDPSRVLKIGTDEFTEIKILATGSSTLDATRKFSDTLTGRKIVIYLPPVLWDECDEPFHHPDLNRRLLLGGLPELFLSGKQDTSFYSEWMDSFYARDIQELFNIRNRSGYIRLMHLLFRSSGNLISQTQLSRNCDISRPTVITYLESLHIANAIFLLPPFHGGGKREITQQPKCYAFDTGFVAFVRGWNEIREEDMGILWEHLVLDILRSIYPSISLYYWRDKSNREIDFIIKRTGDRVDAIECKINPDQYNVNTLDEFRRIYPKGDNYCFSPFVREPYTKNIREFRIRFVGLAKHLT
jgi:predicted AAA+ superfamily ATPase